MIGIIAIVRGRAKEGAALIVLGLVLSFVGAALVVPSFVRSDRMPSESMAPTFKVGERLVIWRLGGDPNVGDIVVFHPPAGSDSAVCGVTGRSWDPG